LPMVYQQAAEQTSVPFPFGAQGALSPMQSIAFGAQGAPTQAVGLAASITPIVHHGHEPRQDDELAAVIVTISSGSSYDQLFSSVPQMAAAGKRVATYAASPGSLAHIAAELGGHPLHGVQHSSDMHKNLRHLVRDIRSVARDSVVFNWECCSGCENQQFQDKVVVMDLTKLLLDAGHMVMFSDFSLKALISNWDEQKLGPNPFLQVGVVNTHFQLRFNCAKLAACPSAQLQKLSELAADGKAEVRAMSNTIAFSVDSAKADCSDYTCEVLTVMTKADGQLVSTPQPHTDCQVDAHRGLAGHALVSYPSGGRILASAGHWMELSQLDVSESQVMQCAAFYGAAFEREVQSAVAQCTTVAQKQQVCEQYSCQMIQQASPCSYSSM